MSPMTQLQVPLVALLLGTLTYTAQAGVYTLEPCVSQQQLMDIASAFKTTQLAVVHTLDAEPLRKEGFALESKADAFDKSLCNTQNVRGSSTEIACRNEQAILAKQVEQHNQRVKDVNAKVSASLTEAEDRLAPRLAHTRAQIATWDPQSQRLRGDIEKWIEMAKKAQIDAVLQSLETITLSMFDLRKEFWREKAKLDQESIGRFKAWYERYGQALPPAVRNEIRLRVASLSTKADVAELLTYIYKQGSRAYVVAAEARDNTNWATAGRAMVELVKQVGDLGIEKWKKLDPKQIGKGIAIGEMVISQAYGWTALTITEGQVDTLLNLQAKQLEALKSLGVRYAVDVRALNAVKAARKACAAAN